MKGFKPLYNQILVKPNKVEPKTKSGIIIADTNLQIRHQTGTVIAIGCGMITPEGDLAPLQIKVGDLVYFQRGAGFTLKETVDGEEFLLFKETELLGYERSAEVIPIKGRGISGGSPDE